MKQIIYQINKILYKNIEKIYEKYVYYRKYVQYR